MSDDPNQYNFPYRKNYELRITLVWLIAGFTAFLCPYFFDVPSKIYQIFGICFLFLGVLLGRKGIEIYIRKYKLKGYPLEFLDPKSAQTLRMFGIKDKKVIANVCKRKH